MRRLTLIALTGLCLAPASLGAQSSLFGVRGLGQPGQPLSPRARGMGGSFALLDGESAVNPAAIAGLSAVTAGFVSAPSWRHWESPAGTADLRETRFPLIYVGGPLRGTALAAGISIGSYADRDFRLASVDTILLRGALVGVQDTLSSLGGLSEIRLAAGYSLPGGLLLGGGLHFITGSNRLAARRVFADSAYAPVRQTAELAYRGVGFSVGLVRPIGQRVQLGLTLRSDGSARVERDSAKIFSVDLPYTVAAGIVARPSRRVMVAGQATFKSWSSANSDLLAQGGTGARNTLEVSAGAEYARNRRKPLILPVRLGLRYARLPFPVITGGAPHEFALSGGTGLRFAQDRAGIDLALEQVWRSEGTPYAERALTLVLGLTVRPYGAR